MKQPKWQKELRKELGNWGTLTTDEIVTIVEEHLAKQRDEAYKKGYIDGKKKD